MAQNENLVFGVNPVLEKIHASSADIAGNLNFRWFRSRRVTAHRPRSRATRFAPLSQFSAKSLDRLAEGQRHQGVVAKVDAYCYLPFEDSLQEISATKDLEWILILDGLTDPRNFGALLRSAEAVGIRHVVIPKDCLRRGHSRAVKASAGAAYHVSISKVTNLRRAISQLKERGYWVVGLDAAVPTAIYERSYPTRLAIVLGSEGGGMCPLILHECDFLVSIPMLGKVESLNVGAAAAVFFYELLRQSRNLKPRNG